LDVFVWLRFIKILVSKHIYIIAGEASGDLYGSKLLAALHAIDPELKVRGWGGEKMAAEGCALDVRYEEASFMGFAEVILNLRKIMGLFKLTKKSILRDKPDAMVLIDYPGFKSQNGGMGKKKQH
jgi:lipid-A-disaccharide synthase